MPLPFELMWIAVASHGGRAITTAPYVWEGGFMSEVAQGLSGRRGVIGGDFRAVSHSRLNAWRTLINIAQPWGAPTVSQDAVSQAANDVSQDARSHDEQSVVSRCHAIKPPSLAELQRYTTVSKHCRLAQRPLPRETVRPFTVEAHARTYRTTWALHTPPYWRAAAAACGAAPAWRAATRARRVRSPAG